MAAHDSFMTDQQIMTIHNGFTWVSLGSLSLIVVDVGDLEYRVLNLKNESNKQTHKHTEDS